MMNRLYCGESASNSSPTPAPCMAIAVNVDEHGSHEFPSAAKAKQASKRNHKEIAHVEPLMSTNKKKTEIASQESPALQRIKWTAENIETLLEIRFSVLSTKKFNACKTTKQKNQWWAWLASRVSARLQCPVQPKQVQNRYQLLKAEYRSHFSAEKETGNQADRVFS